MRAVTAALFALCVSASAASVPIDCERWNCAAPRRRRKLKRFSLATPPSTGVPGTYWHTRGSVDCGAAQGCPATGGTAAECCAAAAAAAAARARPPSH